MFVERVTLANFRCFGPEPQSIDLSPGFTALIGVNGSGKTAVMDGMLRLMFHWVRLPRRCRENFLLRRSLLFQNLMMRPLITVQSPNSSNKWPLTKTVA